MVYCALKRLRKPHSEFSTAFLLIKTDYWFFLAHRQNHCYQWIAGSARSTRSPPTVSARTHLIGPHAYNFSTNQSDAYTFSTGQSQVYKKSTGQSQACRFSTVGFCWWPVVVTSPTDTACTQATRRVWAGNPAFETSKTRQEKSLYWDLRDWPWVL